MILSIITVSRYYDDDLLKTNKSVDDDFSHFIGKYDVEHIVICSEEVKYANEYKRKYIYTPPKGIYNAMNIGLNNANGEWVWFLNAGDECMRDISTKLLHIMNSCSESIIKSGVEVIGDDVKIVFGRIVAPHQGTFYRKKILNIIGGYREDYKIISDWIVFNVLLSKKIKMYQSNLIVAKFYKNGVTSTNEGKWLICKESFKYTMEYPISLYRWYRFFISLYKCI
jgi:glycosyltransferase involved in cell wall biosynthesis